MSGAQQLVDAISAVDLAGNVARFARETALVDRIARSLRRLAQWARQLENGDGGNPALTFTREMQAQGHYAVLLIAAGLYKPAANAMRAMVEAALYYTFFRSHPAELQTLLRDDDYFIDRRTVIEFHKRHSDGFRPKQEKLGLISRLDRWYARASAIVHGQIPGEWTTHTNLRHIGYNEVVCSAAVEFLVEAEEIIHRLFLSTITDVIWHGFSVTGKRELLKGLPPEAKNVLGLTIA